MCKHILNAQVSIRAPCCRKFFDCPQCHEDTFGGDHKLARTTEMQMVCKKCRRAFRKDLSRFEDEDEYCPHCDNRYVIEAKTQEEPSSDIEEATQDVDLRTIDENTTQLLDPRIRYDPRKDWMAHESQSKTNAERIDEGGVAGVIADREQKERQMQQAARQMHAIQHAQARLQDLNDDDLDWS